MQRLQSEQKQTMDYNMSYAMMTSQENAIDEHAMLAKKDILVALSQWQQDRTGPMQKLFLDLCGCFYDKNTRRLTKSDFDMPYTNVSGAKKLITFIENLDRNVMLGNWSEKNIILTLREAIAKPLVTYLRKNHAELGLKLYHAEYVFWLIINSVEPTYWRGFNNGERRKDSEIIKVQEVRNPYFQQKKRGVFGIENPTG